MIPFRRRNRRDRRRDEDVPLPGTDVVAPELLFARVTAAYPLVLTLSFDKPVILASDLATICADSLANNGTAGVKNATSIFAYRIATDWNAGDVVDLDPPSEEPLVGTNGLQALNTAGIVIEVV